MRTRNLILIPLLIINIALRAQETKKERKWELNGYFSDMQSVMFQHPDSMWMMDNLIHNRINFNWYISKSFSSSVQVRNRFMYGDQIRVDPTGKYAKNIANDRGLVDLSENIFSKQSFLLNTSIDRCWLGWEKGKLNIKLGRQRINWGQTFVWNPNDIFNSYSFFDFDYPERPGSDALRLQYYTGMASVAELAFKVDEDEKLTAAGLFRFNKWNYDIQCIAGVLNQNDYVIGGGWSGAIKSIGFRGELSYFHPTNNATDTTGLLFATVGFDYTFKNSTFIQLEALYSQKPEDQQVLGFTDYYSAPLTVKNLAFTEYNLFCSVSRPLTPLLNVSLSGMYYPKIEGYYVGPSVSYSLKDNVDFSFFVQTFSGNFPDPLSGKNKRQDFFMSFLRLKWSY